MFGSFFAGRRLNWSARYFFCSLGVFLSSTVCGVAGEKIGDQFEIRPDVVGVSGYTGLTSENGFRLNQTVGGPVISSTLRALSGWSITPGLWGGGQFLCSSADTHTLFFGDIDHPAQLNVPPNALARDWILFVSTSPMSQPLAVAPAIIQTANAGLARTLTRYTRPLNDQLWEILAIDETGSPCKELFRAPAILSLPYEDDDNDGLVDGTVPPVRVTSLSVWWLDEAHQLWVRLPDSRLDTAKRNVSAPIRHFSIYTVMGAPTFYPGDAYAFPVPWRPNGPLAGAGAGQTGTLSGGITFTNLPSIAQIRIFTLSGLLVRDITHSDGTAQLNWDVRNENGEDVVSGTYIFVIESAGTRKTGKLVVIR
jgi:hypothetical protein